MNDQTQQTEIVNEGEAQTQDKAIAKKKQHPALEWLDTKLDTIAGYCSHGITPAQLKRTYATAILRDPDIGRCTQESIILAVAHAARLGIDPTGERNGGHFIAWKNNKLNIIELKLTLGYGALISLIIRNTDIIDIQVEVVYREEHFKFYGGTDQRLEHELDFQIRNVRDYKEVIAAYAVATFANGLKKAVVLSRMELNKAQAASQGGANSVWKFNPIEMAKKTPIRNMSKWLDIGPDFNEAVKISDEGDGYDFSSNRPTPEEKQNSVSNLRDRLSNARSNQSPELPETTSHQSGEYLANDMPAHIAANTERATQ